MSMTISPWQLFVDLGLAAVLLLVGQLLRSRVRAIQWMFLHASVIGGFIGLGLGPNGADVLMMAAAFSAEPGILIALLFAALPFAWVIHSLWGAVGMLVAAGLLFVVGLWASKVLGWTNSSS